jgi:hypothetical protein
MDGPSREPDSPPPPNDGDGCFWIVLLTPIALFVIAVLLVDGSGSSQASNILARLAGLGAVISSIMCGVTVGMRKGLSAGILTFLGVLMLYAAIAFAGCMWMVRGLSQ